jgi:hypothetical protein
LRERNDLLTCLIFKDCNAGFNFARDEEAEKFYNTVINKIMSKNKRSTKQPLGTNNNSVNTTSQQQQQQKTQQQSRPAGPAPPVAQPVSLHHQQAPSSANSVNTTASSSSSGGFFSSFTDSNKFGTVSKGKDKKNAKKIDKSQISCPTGFRVVQHVGLSGSSGASDNNSSSTLQKFEISLSNQDETSKMMRDILATLNVPINKRTQEFVDMYIQSHGGIDKFKEELKYQKPTQQQPQQNMQQQQQQQYNQQQNQMYASFFLLIN